MSRHRVFDRKFKLTLLTAVLLTAACSSLERIKPVYLITGGSDNSDVIDQAYEQGRRHFRKGRYGTAIAHFQSALDNRPNSIMALNGLGASYDKLGRYQPAMRYYHQALLIDPDSTITLNNLGFSLALQGLSVRARETLTLALLKDPDNHYARINRQMVSARMAILRHAPDSTGASSIVANPPPAENGAIHPILRRAATPETAVQSRAAPTGQPDITAPPPPRNLPDTRYMANRSLDSPLYGPIRRGKNLWRIALQLSHARGTDHARLLDALLRCNPEAFIEGDINRLKAGYTLWVPSSEEILASSAPIFNGWATAMAEFTIEVSNGNGRRGMAYMVAAYLKDQGGNVSRITNARHYDLQKSVIDFTPDHQAAAQQLADRLPFRPVLKMSHRTNARVAVRLILGKDLLQHEADIRKSLLNRKKV